MRSRWPFAQIVRETLTNPPIDFVYDAIGSGPFGNVVLLFQVFYVRNLVKDCLMR
jgi:hypothetical protein